VNTESEKLNQSVSRLLKVHWFKWVSIGDAY
jgi:hypothetical protein